MRHQHIYNLAEVCAQRGILHTVICPGSRSAPLVLAFTNHPKIKCKVILDERSAGFVALGMAQALEIPVALVCTSGSAAYNFAPAVVEAFYQHVPLIVFTADRPAEWIDQRDGQTIRQAGIFGTHVKKYFEFPDDENPARAWMTNRMVNDALNISQSYPSGPVHINSPLREPLYPLPKETIEYQNPRVITTISANLQLPANEIRLLKNRWSSFSKILIVAGQEKQNQKLTNLLYNISSVNNIPVISDILSNLHALPHAVRNHELFLNQANDQVKEQLRPTLLITMGKGIISKSLKLMLRQYTPNEHWHIQPAGETADTYQSLTHIIRCSPEYFFEQIPSPSEKSFEKQKQLNYNQIWQAEEDRALLVKKENLSESKPAELSFVKTLFNHLPDRCNLHLANSMSVRYANLVSLQPDQSGVHVFCNRGTSGIDGCSSTIVGHSLVHDIPNILLTGDVAFFYDRNAFWHNYKLPNLRICVLNNHGGQIFSMIDGPQGRAETKEFFISNQPLNGQHLCAEFGFEYLKADHQRKWKNLIKDFFEFNGKTKVLEFESDQNANQQIYDLLKLKMKEKYE